MKDYLVRGIAYDGQVRAFATNTTATVGEAQRRHNTWPVVSAALGRSMTASVMMGAMLKGDDKITVKIEGNGPIGPMVIDADAKGDVRGFVTNPHVHFELNEQGKLDVRAGVGSEGALTVVKDLGLRDMFSGQTPIVSGEIAEDFTYYFATSEQVPSSVGLGVLVNPDNTILAAGGFIIQLMPGCEEETIEAIEKHLSSIEPVSKMIEKGYTPEQILEAVLGEGNVQILSTMPVQFQCQCSKERFGAAIIGLGVGEIQEMIDEDGQAEAQCHFCLETYHFDKSELEGFVNEIQS
ncbi:molecular chaperone Hsp33 [Solibacillus kalamii]|uniref:33 kDa chaperonin n=3 Tax=Solibacillus TaxID=648800 RepID=F2F171_SOLSS|nr:MULTISPECIES: Hsp33 family molecular chaperone HslO [Solibacillus]AMO87515.1 molecular chaperone Hsp33 [Solibacillus silvestris]EKB43768.1 parvulin-like peptidyl-prolyl isomerase [Solibacillus isronensis B3W22]MBM7667136.1 molecular chaperone Hsp33 [Solibacillus kalamii]OBW59241.1 Hsp33 family molecular chaperone [Solibacillus silvestris]OUZ37426.1 redox-regulated molecular chaperone Hsp33 [Solibacillus kalamii]